MIEDVEVKMEKRKVISAEEKLRTVQRVQRGESLYSIEKATGYQRSQIRNWIQKETFLHQQKAADTALKNTFIPEPRPLTISHKNNEFQKFFLVPDNQPSKSDGVKKNVGHSIPTEKKQMPACVNRKEETHSNASKALNEQGNDSAQKEKTTAAFSYYEAVKLLKQVQDILKEA